MKLNENEKNILIEYGYSSKDIKQIERLKYIYILYNEKEKKEITEQEAKKILTIEDFLTGVARSAFHRTASRKNIVFEGKV